MSTVHTIMLSIDYTILVVALLLGCFFLTVWMLEQGLRAVRVYREFCEYVWHRNEFRAWLKNNCKRYRPEVAAEEGKK